MEERIKVSKVSGPGLFWGSQAPKLKKACSGWILQKFWNAYGAHSETTFSLGFQKRGNCPGPNIFMRSSTRAWCHKASKRARHVMLVHTILVAEVATSCYKTSAVLQVFGNLKNGFVLICFWFLSVVHPLSPGFSVFFRGWPE